MNEGYKERALRAAVAALLGTNLSAHDLRRLSQELLSGDLGFEIGRALERALEALSPNFYREPPYEYPSALKAAAGATKQVESALRTIKNRKLTKENVIQFIQQAGGPVRPTLDPRTPVKEIVSDFFARASISQRQEFLELISHTPPQDPYLKGIANR